MTRQVTRIASLGPDSAVDRTTGLAILGEMVGSTALSTLQRSPCSSDTGAVGFDVSRSATAKALFLLVNRRAVRLDVSLATTAVTLLSVDGGAVGLDVAFTTAVVALFGFGGAWSWTGRGLVTRFETVEASSVGVAAVFG